MDEIPLYQETVTPRELPVFFLDVDASGNLSFGDFSPACERITGLYSEDLLGLPPETVSVLALSVAVALSTNCQRCLDAGAPLAYDEESEWPVGVRCFHILLVPVVGNAGCTRIMGVLEDITERKKKESILRRLSRELQALSCCNQTLLRAEDEQTLLNDICRIVCDQAGCRLAWVGYTEPDEGRTVRPVAWAGADNDHVTHAAVRWSAETEQGEGPAGLAIRSGNVVCVQDLTVDPRTAPWCASLTQLGCCSGIAIPLKNEHADVFGVFLLYHEETNAMGPDEVRFMTKFAEDLAFGVRVLRTRAERRRSEEALARKEEEHRALLANIPDFVVRYSTDLRRIYVNPAWEKASGLSSREVVNVHITDTPRVPVPAHAGYLDRLRYVLETGIPQTIEFDWVNAYGESLFLQYSIVPEYDRDGRTVGVLSVGRDLTRRKQAEEARQADLTFFENMDRVSRVIQRTSDLGRMIDDVLDETLSIFECDRTWLVYTCDLDAASFRVPMERTRPEFPGAVSAGCEVPADEAVGQMLRVLKNADHPVQFGPAPAHPLPEALAKRFGIQSQIMMLLDPKIDKPYAFGLHQCSFPRVWTPEEERLFQEIGIRIGEALTSFLAFRNLCDSEAKMRAILDNIGIGVSVIDQNMAVVELNRRMREWFPDADPSEHPFCYHVLNDPPGEAICVYCPTRRTLADGQVHEAMVQKVRQGKIRSRRIVSSPIFGAGGEVVAAIEMVEDVTDRLALEMQLRQSQKMDAVGRLAGGIAHDFNNLLASVVNYVELCQSEFPAEHPVQEYLKEILSDTARSSRLVRQLLAFARGQETAPVVLNLNEAVTEMIKLLRHLVGGAIGLEWMPGPELWPVEIDPSQVDQILVNLCVNARDAIDGTGKITIETRNMLLDEVFCLAHTEAVPGQYVLLKVNDNGCGMNEETLARIFEPFFTTKEPGRGTGLGLATLYGIVKQNRGFVHVVSEEGKGTTFFIYLPRSLKAVELQTAESGRRTDLKGSETILLVDDERALRTTCSHFLQKLGYTVLVAENPAKALQIARRHTETINLLITDVFMPGMNGPDLAEALRTGIPGLRSLFMSGYSNDLTPHSPSSRNADFLQKPFTRDQLIQAVRQALDREQPSAAV